MHKEKDKSASTGKFNITLIPTQNLQNSYFTIHSRKKIDNITVDVLARWSNRVTTATKML